MNLPFIQAFPTAKTQSLKETYLIKTNSIQLMNELRNTFPQIYTFAERTYEDAVPLTDSMTPISNNTTFFDNSKFVLQHFSVNGEQQGLILTHNDGRGTRGVPHIYLLLTRKLVN